MYDKTTPSKKPVTAQKSVDLTAHKTPEKKSGKDDTKDDKDTKEEVINSNWCYHIPNSTMPFIIKVRYVFSTGKLETICRLIY